MPIFTPSCPICPFWAIFPPLPDGGKVHFGHSFPLSDFPKWGLDQANQDCRASPEFVPGRLGTHHERLLVKMRSERLLVKMRYDPQLYYKIAHFGEGQQKDTKKGTDKISSIFSRELL